MIHNVLFTGNSVNFMQEYENFEELVEIFDDYKYKSDVISHPDIMTYLQIEDKETARDIFGTIADALIKQFINSSCFSELNPDISYIVLNIGKLWALHNSKGAGDEFLFE